MNINDAQIHKYIEMDYSAEGGAFFVQDSLRSCSFYFTVNVSA